MNPAPEFHHLTIHTRTLPAWTLPELVEQLVSHGVGGISVWRDAFEADGIQAAAGLLQSSGLVVSALVRGGFFVGRTAQERQQAIDDNLRCLDEAAAIGAKMVVLVVGSVPGLPLEQARLQVQVSIAAILPHAEALGIRLAIEPLHPMYAADKSCINRLADARAVWEALDHPLVGTALDVYHTWWDPDLAYEIRLAGQQQRLFGFHVCDWLVDTDDLLLDRGLMGEGCIDLAEIREQVSAAGFDGQTEVEIFSTRHWQRSPDEFLAAILDAARTLKLGTANR